MPNPDAIRLRHMPEAADSAKPGRPIEECIAIAKARRSKAVLDEDFARDLQEIIDSRATLDTSSWD